MSKDLHKGLPKCEMEKRVKKTMELLKRLGRNKPFRTKMLIGAKLWLKYCSADWSTLECKRETTEKFLEQLQLSADSPTPEEAEVIAKLEKLLTALEENTLPATDGKLTDDIQSFLRKNGYMRASFIKHYYLGKTDK